MQRFKKLIILLLLFMIVSGFLGTVIKSREYAVNVPKGFAFGAPNNQSTMSVDGMYAVTSYGYPVTYKITETFRPTGDVFNALSYDAMPFNPAGVVANFIFWMGLFVALLAPVTIFWRPQKMSPATSTFAESPEPETEESGKDSAHNRN